MRSLKSGLVAFASAGLFVSAAIVGCSADGGSADLGTDTPATEPTDNGAQLPAPSQSSSSGGTPTDAGTKKDSGAKSDAGVDAGPPPPNPGDSCAKVDDVVTRPCGACGTQQALCLANGDAGGGKWSDYGACQGELAGGCTPGTTVTEACGNCGTVVKTCNKYCAYTAGSCTGQPASSCTPGGVELSTAGCTTADTYRQRTCAGTCTWGNFSATCSPPPTYVNVAPTVGSVNNSLIFLKATQTITRLTGSCPSGSLSTTVTPYNYFEVKNPTAKTAVVSIYHSQAMGGPVIDTVIAAYAGATPPSGDAPRKACNVGVGDFGDTTLTGDGSFASLSGTKTVSIPAGQSVIVYSAAYDAYDAADPANTTGTLKLNVKTEQLN